MENTEMDERERLIEDILEYREKTFATPFYRDFVPNCYICGNCSSSKSLVTVEHSFVVLEAPHSVTARESEYWQCEDVETTYCCQLTCTACGQQYISSGTGSLEEEVHTEHGLIHVDVFFPKYFIPTMYLFPIPSSVPASIKKILVSAFDLAWMDYSAAANKLRVALELMTKELVPPSGKSSLGNMINDISDEKIKSLFKSIKWLGNQGSHEGNLKEYDLACAFSTIEHALPLVYPEVVDDTEIMRFASLVNRAKGSV